MKKYEEIKIFPNFVMPSEDTKMFEFNQYQKSDKAPLIIYANVKQKILIDVKITFKIDLQQKQVNIFYQVFQCLQC